MYVYIKFYLKIDVLYYFRDLSIRLLSGAYTVGSTISTDCLYSDVNSAELWRAGPATIGWVNWYLYNMYTFYIYRRSFVHKKGEKDIRNPDECVKGIFPSSRWLKAVAQRTTSRFAIKQFRKYCVDGDFDTEVFSILLSLLLRPVYFQFAFG